MSDARLEFSSEYELFLRELGNLVKKAQNRGSLNKKLAIVMQRDVQKHFEDEQSPFGKWVGLQPMTIMRKGSSAILKDTRRLLQSIKIDSNNNKAETGTNLVYAKTHNYGRGRIPQREFMWLSKEAENRMVDTVVTHWWGTHTGTNTNFK